MSLKDASAYNIQFVRGKPTLIDTLSFEIYKEGEPWVAYRQFCQHFLAPLALMAYRDMRLGQLLRVYIDGVPLDLASKLLPVKTQVQFWIADTHPHCMQARKNDIADKAVAAAQRRSVKAGIDRLDRKPRSDGQKVDMETRRHRMGQLLRKHQLHRCRLRA